MLYLSSFPQWQVEEEGQLSPRIAAFRVRCKKTSSSKLSGIVESPRANRGEPLVRIGQPLCFVIRMEGRSHRVVSGTPPMDSEKAGHPSIPPFKRSEYAPRNLYALGLFLLMLQPTPLRAPANRI